MKFGSPLVLAVLCLLASSSAGTAGGRSPAVRSVDPPTLDTLQLRAFRARSIGPAVMGGRVSSIALDPQDPFTWYVGLGTGGVMKTSNDGATFDPIFEKQAVAAIGAIAIAPSNPKQVWVGTGEANDRNSSSWGDGVYRSTDAGGSWTNMGLRDSKTIARIAVDPADTNTVWVAAMGDLWSDGRGERGLFKTTDGGKTWHLVLSGPRGYTEKVGCGDVAIDPSHPDTLYAALYARLRTPWSFVYGPAFTDGKDLGGIFRSNDGGSSWKKLTNGLPQSTGRIGLDVYAKDPRVVYAIVQSDEGGTSNIDDVHSKKGGVFRSDDCGEHWTRLSPLDPRPFYFSQIRVDPTNDKRVYVLGYMMHVSDDGGRSFQENFFDKVHPDCHALAIDPRNSKKIILGTDGGVYQSFAGGKGWIHMENMASGEFYRIALDMKTPFRIAGGLQDNNNWVGPSRTRTREGILNSDWINIGGGDGFYCVFDPTDTDLVYAESQEGYVHRYNFRTGEFKGLRPEPEEGQPAFRFHWVAPFIPSLHTPGVMYLGGNRVFKLTNHGETWKLISPDLSTRDVNKIMTVGSGAENYGVVFALAESPLRAGMLWAGTDDGKLWVTTDEGEHWRDLSRGLPKAARDQWMNRIEPGHFDANTAYLAVDAHRTGDYAPLVYRTTDEGTSWTSVAGNLPADGPVKVIREDLHNPDLLFAGTEFHLFISMDRGRSWTRFGELPTVSVDDIVIHPRDLDMVIATHGRSLYVIDDIRPLEQFTGDAVSKEVMLFPIRPAEGYYPNGGWVDEAGIGIFRGANPPDGALMTFYLKNYTGDQAKISIADSSGRPAANLSASANPGFNRLAWDLKPTKDLLNDYGGEGQKLWKSGIYTVTLTIGKNKAEQKFRLNTDPGIETR